MRAIVRMRDEEGVVDWQVIAKSINLEMQARCEDFEWLSPYRARYLYDAWFKIIEKEGREWVDLLEEECATMGQLPEVYKPFKMERKKNARLFPPPPKLHAPGY
jgi:hypothetical protein